MASVKPKSVTTRHLLFFSFVPHMNITAQQSWHRVVVLPSNLVFIWLDEKKTYLYKSVKNVKAAGLTLLNVGISLNYLPV